MTLSLTQPLVALSSLDHQQIFIFSLASLLFNIIVVLPPGFPLSLPLYLPWISFMPRERGRPKLASGNRSLVRSHTARNSSFLGYNCVFHSQMEARYAFSTSTNFDEKPTPVPPLSSTPTNYVPDHVQASSSHPPPPPHHVFREAQHNIIRALRGDNDEHKFWQVLMEKGLDWLLDSGAKDPKQRHNEEELL